jgi:hypothetical protein
LHNRWRGDLGEERRDWVGVELEEEFTGGGSGTFKVYFYDIISSLQKLPVF